MQARCVLLDERTQIFYCGSTLTSKYFTTGVRECTLLRNRFVMVCLMSSLCLIQLQRKEKAKSEAVAAAA